MGAIEPNQRQQSRSPLRLMTGTLGLIAVLGALVVNARMGYSSWLTAKAAADEAAISSLDTAIRLDPSNGHPYDVRARALLSSGRIAEAVKDFESAVRLRPNDYLFWLRLGYSRSKLGDREGAREAYAMSLRLAPHYARPHWYMGTLLLKMGLRDEAFADFRSAVAADQDYLPHVINTAWRQFEGDAAAVERAVKPRNGVERLALARAFLDHQKIVEAVNLFRKTGEDANAEREELVADLLSAKQFVPAYELWSIASEDKSAERTNMPIVNGDFEDKINLENLGFGWRLAQRLDQVVAVHDSHEPNSGSASLRLEFNGDSNPATGIISQVILVQPRTKYRVSFVARTHSLITGGLPVITVTNAIDGSRLAQSQTMRAGSGSWQRYPIEFTTTDNIEAVTVSVKREACSSSPCPAFGRLWLDSFLIERL